MTYRWVPVYADPEQRLAVMSIGFLLKNRDDSVIWRGPKKNGMAVQLSLLIMLLFHGRLDMIVYCYIHTCVYSFCSNDQAISNRCVLARHRFLDH